MVAVIWHPDGHRHLAGHGTYRESDGDVTHHDGDDISITALGAWVSPETGVEYPSGWRVEVAPPGLELELTPLVEQSEFTSEFIKVSYWEGAVSVTGRREGPACDGLGFRGTGGATTRSNWSPAQAAAAVDRVSGTSAVPVASCGLQV